MVVDCLVGDKIADEPIWVDAEQTALPVGYPAAYSPTTVVALLPEDAQALSDSYRRIEEI